MTIYLKHYQTISNMRKRVRAPAVPPNFDCTLPAVCILFLDESIFRLLFQSPAACASPARRPPRHVLKTRTDRIRCQYHTIIWVPCDEAVSQLKILETRCRTLGSRRW